ncbi:protein yippee-like 1 isoform X2 [Nothobranchius furzeri]|uniref:protein yippee-like 1 isoform X2 n=1 Tax=Nothobranchius furzeri TaxID=105023 RepID=UPI0024044B9C|nr:protein yippee-like 1 isoform X2 [Nothobranchius furzeri]
MTFWSKQTYGSVKILQCFLQTPAAAAEKQIFSAGCFGVRGGRRPSVFGPDFFPVVSVWSVPHTHSTTTTAFACIFQCFFCQQVQQSCNSSSASPDTSEEPCPTDMVKMTKSKTFQAYLPSCHRTYSCIHCRAHLANHDELISKEENFLLRSGSDCAAENSDVRWEEEDNFQLVKYKHDIK